MAHTKKKKPKCPICGSKDTELNDIGDIKCKGCGYSGEVDGYNTRSY